MVLEREEHVAADSCLAASVVLVEAVTLFIPNPADFWTEQ